jgi:chemotaxis protein histidine kinase CheA/ActR/RegA family two-component response regulator
MATNFDKFAILDSFLDEVASYLPEIQAHLDRLQQRPDDRETIEETYRRTHTIAGSAAMMEFTGLSRVSQGMEDVLGDALDRHVPLDPPTVALLRRSLSRLEKLLEHVKSGADDGPLIAEDDADRAASRGVASGGLPTGPRPPANGQAFDAAARGGPTALAGTPSTPPDFKVPEWLTAFGGPAPSQPQGAAAPYAPAGGGSAPPPGGWSSSVSNLPTGQIGAMPPGAPAGAPEATLDDMLRAFQATAGEPPAPAANAGRWGEQSAAPQWGVSTPAAPWQGMMPSTPPGAGWQAAPQVPYDISALSTGAMPPQAPAGAYGAYGAAPTGSYGGAAWGPAQPPAPAGGPLDELRADEEAIRRQVGVLREVSASMHEAAQAMEDERGELRSFLDGSRDALERLEEWAGQQMGLDLRQSPESVRRYLPLSVIWVTTTRLKRLAAALTNSGRTVTATQEQIDETLNELRTAINSFGQIYGALSAVGGAPESGFSATVAHFNWQPTEPPAPSYHAVESTPQPSWAASPEAELSPGARVELEREVRDQLRRELEDDVRDEIAAEVRREEEDRLRQELQIQVRRELLTELSPGMGAFGLATTGQVLPNMPLVSERAPKPVQVTSEFSPEALAVFRDEAQEHLQTITAGIAELERSPGDVGVLQSIRRAMHTLKGAAGMMGFTVIQQIAHASEDQLDQLVATGKGLTPNLLSLLLDTSEGLDQLVSGAVSAPEDQQALLRSLLSRYASAAGKPTSSLELPHADTARVEITDDADEPATRTTADTASDLSVRLQLSKLDDLVNLFGELLINRSILEERVDRINRVVGDTVVVSERLRDVGTQLETRFEAATLPSGRAGPGVMGSGAAQGGTRGANSGRGVVGGLRADTPSFSNEFDELELDRYTEFHRLTRGLSEGVADVVTLSHEMEAIIRECQASFARESRLSSDFQDRLLKARLVPLESLVPRLYRAARASALREGKEIEFFSEGTSTEVDRKVFEEVAGPLLHLVRNAVNHGIEPPQVREAAGKPSAGKILVSAAYEGNQVVISVRDDGAGIDPEKISATATARGWIDAYASLSEKEAINLIFQPGVTTAETLTEEAGRGVGLDVVHDSVTRLRGTIEVESTVGQGTVFTMKFPISLQIARAVLVKVGQQTLAIPMAVVDQIGRLDYYQRVHDPEPALEMRGESYPLAHLAHYLKVQPGQVGERASVLLVNAGKRRVALVVDAVVAQQEIVSKPLGPHLREVRGVTGAAVLGNGQVVLILELHELLSQQLTGSVVLPEPGTTVTQLPTGPLPTMPPTSSATSARTQVETSTAPTVPTLVGTPPTRRDFVVAPRETAGPELNRIVVPPAARDSYVLVVDDSPSVRRVVSNMLKAHGWEVQTARDGVEALEVIARQMPAVVLLDIEMPRMDGYELMATVRSQEQYRQLPLVVLTSRAATKHQQRALQLGADAYVVKPYQDEELLTTLATLVQARLGS